MNTSANDRAHSRTSSVWYLNFSCAVPELTFTRHLMRSVGRALRYGLGFAFGFLVFLFSTILMVRGDGTAPAVTHLSAGIIDFTVKLLGIPDGGSVLAVVLFWSSGFFLLVFIISIIFYRGQLER